MKKKGEGEESTREFKNGKKFESQVRVREWKFTIPSSHSNSKLELTHPAPSLPVPHLKA